MPKKYKYITKTGRPTKYNEDVIKRFESVFQLGVTDRTACSYVGIHHDTYYSWLKEKPEFTARISKAKHFARIAAGSVVKNAIVNDRDVATARWWLEKKHPDEFKSGGTAVGVRTNGEKIEVVVKDY